MTLRNPGIQIALTSVKFPSKDTTVVARDLWASGEDITRQLTEAQRATLVRELFP